MLAVHVLSLSTQRQKVLHTLSDVKKCLTPRTWRQKCHVYPLSVLFEVERLLGRDTLVCGDFGLPIAGPRATPRVFVPCRPVWQSKCYGPLTHWLISAQMSTTSNRNGAFTLNLFQTHRLNPQSQCHANNTPQARNNGHAAFAATLS